MAGARANAMAALSDTLVVAGSGRAVEASPPEPALPLRGVRERGVVEDTA